MRLLSIIVISVLVYCSSVHADEILEVKGVSVNSYFYREGKMEVSSDGGDQVVYAVDLPNKRIIRTAVFNAGFKSEDPLGGLQADNSEYVIVWNAYNSVANQKLIKAFGQVAPDGGFETIVIGDNFIITSRTSADYFALYYYRRTK